MTALQIDTAAARRAATTWANWADQINAAQMHVGVDIEPLWLAQASSACSRMSAAATEIWTVSSFLTLLVAQLETLDGGPVLVRESAFDELMWLAGGRRGSIGSCPAGSYAGADGERGGTYRADLRSPYDLSADDPSSLGRQLVMRALRDTGTPGQIRKDEFEIVELSDGRYLVTLPGVIDLSDFDIGLDPDNRSVRDLDRSALRSSIDTSISGNAYARMVWHALVARGVPLGSRLVIVGHSFGADTALDLASDRDFNGPSGFDVTHVVAAAYDSESQLNDIPRGTHVLALTNRDDVPVLAETAEHLVTQPLEDAREVVDGVVHLDAGEALGGWLRTVRRPLLGAAAPALHAVTRADDVLSDLRHREFGTAAEDAVLPLPSVEQRGDSQLDVVFDEGFGGYGHHQDRYLDYVEGTSDPLVLGFFGSLAMGTAVTGTAVAVDVSVRDKSEVDAQKT